MNYDNDKRAYLVCSSSDTKSAMDDLQRLFQMTHLKHSCSRLKVRTQSEHHHQFLDHDCAKEIYLT